jgi:hypothetical protein
MVDGERHRSSLTQLLLVETAFRNSGGCHVE